MWLFFKSKFASAYKISPTSHDYRRRCRENIFSKWRLSAILNFRNFLFWSENGMCQLLHSKFCISRTINMLLRCSRKTIFIMASVPYIILDLKKKIIFRQKFSFPFFKFFSPKSKFASAESRTKFHRNRMISGGDIENIDFQYSVRPPSWIDFLWRHHIALH